MRKFLRCLCVFFLAVTTIIFGLIIVGTEKIPNEFNLVGDMKIKLGGLFKAAVLEDIGSSEKSVNANSSTNEKISYKANINILGIIPVKNANVKLTERRYVVPSGEIIGIRLYTNGVIIVGIDEVMGENGLVNPGKIAGLNEGDVIKSINSEEIRENSQLSKIFENSGGQPLKLIIDRNGEEMSIDFATVLSVAENRYQGGIWVRDSSAGIGTLTFYDKDTGVFAGLGHAICDIDTKSVMPLAGGDILTANIKGIYKGSPGSTGELCGVFGDMEIGNLLINGDTGLYGKLYKIPENAKVIPVATKNEVEVGPAQIIATVEDGNTKKYDVKILKVNYNEDGTKKNMTVEITDTSLIAKTGGIVQGMSGCPIIQNDKLIGAVTHVFLNNPLQGFGIFAENMLTTSDSLHDIEALDLVA